MLDTENKICRLSMGRDIFFVFQVHPMSSKCFYFQALLGCLLDPSCKATNKISSVVFGL